MSESSAEFKWHRAVGAFASLFLLGAGQLALGRYRRAGVLLGAYLTCIVLGVTSQQRTVMDIAILLAILLRIFGVADMAVLTPAKRVPETGLIALLWIGLAGVLLFQSLLLRQFVVEAFRIPSGAMIPSVQIGDQLVINKLTKQPPRGEIIVFTYPMDTDKDFIKRVVAIGGDTVQVCGGQVLLDGAPLHRVLEPGKCEYDDADEDRPGWHKTPCVAYREWNGKESYITVHNPGNGEWGTQCTTPMTVPPGQFFVMGDNRDNSHDSRFWGTVKKELVKGKAWFIWWSKGADQIRWQRINQLIHQPAPPAPTVAPTPPASP